jgi:hypothetical protein
MNTKLIIGIAAAGAVLVGGSIAIVANAVKTVKGAEKAGMSIKDYKEHLKAAKEAKKSATNETPVVA